MIDPRTLRPLKLGPAAIRKLLPHRPPLLLVDSVSSCAPNSAGLNASRAVTSSEPVFAGHFPELWMWPGAYTIEGLAQSCALAGALAEIYRGLTERGQDPEKVLAHMDAWGPGGATEVVLPLPRPPMLVAVDVKLTRPVYAGQTLEYTVVRTHDVAPMARFDVKATVEGHVVAKGALTVARGGEG